jgi:hypothetical protein
VELDAGVDILNKVLDEGEVSRDVRGPYADPKPGDRVVKFGRGVYTFSTRSGTVRGYGTVQVACDGATFVARDQIITDFIGSPGDSGSGLYHEDLRPAGILFAGSATLTVHSPISAVVRDTGAVPGAGFAVPSLPIIPLVAGISTFTLGAQFLRRGRK